MIYLFICHLSIHTCNLSIQIYEFHWPICRFRSLANGSMKLPSREYKWTTMKGLKYNLTNNQQWVRNYVLKKARQMVMKQTSGLYPAPLKIMEVSTLVHLYVASFLKRDTLPKNSVPFTLVIELWYTYMYPVHLPSFLT